MIAVYVTFRLGEQFDAAALRRIAEEAAPRFVGVPGLHSKTFTVNAARREALNVYLWEEETAARAFFTPEVLARVTSVYGVKPHLDFATVVAQVPA